MLIQKLRNFRRFAMPVSVEITKLGAIVRGIDLNADLSEAKVQQIKNLVHQHRIILFPDQGHVDGLRHVAINSAFGDVNSDIFRGDPVYQHPKSPHPSLHRISNDPEEGCTNAGRSGWHIDGSPHQCPFPYAMYYMAAVPRRGATAFIGFRELLESVSKETRQKWERLWLVPDREGGTAHPLVYRHPATNEPVMCIHLGWVKAFVWDNGTPDERLTDEDETREIVQEINREIVKSNERLVYYHQWKEGEFVITDNLAVAHFASAETQLSREEIGLRVLHRTTVRGTNIPAK